MTHTVTNAEPPIPSQDEVAGFVAAAGGGDNAAVIQFMEKYGSAIIDGKNERGDTALITALDGGGKYFYAFTGPWRRHPYAKEV